MNTEEILRDRQKTLNTKLGFIMDETALELMEEAIDVFKKLRDGRFIPNREEDETDNQWIRRVYRTKGKMEAIQVAYSVKKLHLLEAKKYVEEII